VGVVLMEMEKLQLLWLPEEILVITLSYLSLPQLARTATVCKYVKELVESRCLWRFTLIKVNIKDSKEVKVPLIPTPRVNHSCAVYENKMYMFGGDKSPHQALKISGIDDALYEYNFDTRLWTHITGHEIPHKTNHKSLVYNGNMYIVAGVGNPFYTADTYCYNIEKKIARKIEHEFYPTRSLHIAEIWNDKLYVFGGWLSYDAATCYNDMWEFDFKTEKWTRLHTCAGDLPSSRCAMASSVYQDSLFLFGGWNPTSLYMNELHRFNFKTHQWTLLKPKGECPKGRTRFTMNRYKNKLYVVGGWNKVKYFREIWEYNIDTNTWTEIKSRWNMPQLTQHSAEIYKDSLYIFGGYDMDTSEMSTTVYRMILE